MITVVASLRLLQHFPYLYVSVILCTRKEKYVEDKFSGSDF